MHNKRSHIAIYGQVAIRREYCPSCGGFAFIIDGAFSCCGWKLADLELPGRFKRIIQPEQLRRLPPKSARDKQLQIQESCCFYCERALDGFVFRNGKAVKLRLHWDHQVPYSLTQNNNATNFVAACHVCNWIKSSVVFRTVEEAKVYIHAKRKEKGYV